MGRMILCRGCLGSVPYTFRLSGRRVYSVEELCHYIYHNIYEITEDIFNDALVDWLRDEVNMPLLADKMQNMIMAGSSLKDIVMNVFCSCDYYTEEEVRHIIVLVEELSRKPYYGRQKIKADNYIKYRKYSMAIREYEKLLNGGMVGNLSPEEYGDVLHNLSVAYIHVDRLEEAMDGFKKAYLSNRKTETMERYFYALLLSGKVNELENEIRNMGWGEEKLDEYKGKMESYLKEAEEMEELRKLRKEWKEAGGKDQEAIPEHMNQYIMEWKTKYREDIYH